MKLNSMKQTTRHPCEFKIHITQLFDLQEGIAADG